MPIPAFIRLFPRVLLLRIVFSADWFSEGMGYSENVLPTVLARRGHDVTLVTSTVQVYGDHPFYAETYGRFLGPARVEPVTKNVDGVTLIRLPVIMWWKRFRIARGRLRTIWRLKPDVVLAYDPVSLQTALLSLMSFFAGYKLITAVHTAASVYPAYYSYHEMSLFRRLKLRMTDTFLGWVSSLGLSRCYGATPDGGDIAVRFFAIPKEIVEHLPLGSDTEVFHPLRTDADRALRNEVRRKLDVEEHEFLCIYTGRLTDAKNPLCLARAVELLRGEGHHVRAIFLGEGTQAEAIAATEGCQVRPFVPYRDLPGYYAAAEVGVWPRQESVSMVDAAACGVPIVVSNRIKARERVDGNGILYEEDDAEDMARVLKRLFDPPLRRELGECGAERIAREHSVHSVADRLMKDLETIVA